MVIFPCGLLPEGAKVLLSGIQQILRHLIGLDIVEASFLQGVYYCEYHNVITVLCQ